MMRMSAFTITILAALVAACSDSGPDAQEASHDEVVVLSRNVYVGTDVDRVLVAETPEEMLARVEEVWQLLLTTDFHERAEALADELASGRPHLVGLQEITTFLTQSPGDAIVGGTTPATTVVYDYLDILMDAIEARGLDYQVAAVVEDSDVEVPRPNATFDDVRMVDYDVILARGDVAIDNAAAQNYTATLPVSTPAGTTLELLRGWAAVDATVEGRTYRFVATHLEPADYTDLVQAAQVAELIQIFGAETRPLILVGDLNTRADGSGTPTYATLLDAGYRDVWDLDATPDGSGATCCHPLDLRSEGPGLDERIDFVMVRNVGNPLSVEAWVVGDESADRTPSGMWPSDHAGVMARIFIPREQ